MIFGKKDDGKIRIRCPECGKKLKFRADAPGAILRCPICMHNVIAPLSETAEEEAAETPSPEAPEAQSPTEAPSPAPAAPAPPAKAKPEAAAYPRRAATGGKTKAWTPEAKTRDNASIERLVNFLNRENDRVGGLAVSAIHDPEMPPKQRHRRLLGLRQDKNGRIRAEIDKIVHDLDDVIHGLTHHPSAGQGAIRLQLKGKEEEKAGFLIFLKLIFGLRMANTQKESVNLDE